jgi:hypothetical protein
MPCPGEAGAASRCVTLFDCLPNDLPPPMRFAASALKPDKASTKTKNNDQIFIRMTTPK